MTRLICVTIVAIWALLSPRRSWAQGEHLDVETSPIGGLAGRESISAGGALRAAIPFTLPPARGGIPIPFSVVHHGGRDVGVAGVGWDVPLSFVRVSDNLSRRKPIGGQATSAQTATRVFLELGGHSELMVPSEKTGVYRAQAESSYAELVRIPGGWVALSASGFRYKFSSLPELNDSTLWLLTEIDDSTRKNRLEIEYLVRDVVPPPPFVGSGNDYARLKEILYREIRYSPAPPPAAGASASCFKYRIEPRYRSFGDGPLQVWTDSAHARARAAILSDVIVWEARDTSCAKSDLVASYELLYEPDVDTGLPRLTAVDQKQAGGAPGAPGPRLPMVRYRYGAATSSSALRFGTASRISLPASAPELADGFGGIVFSGNSLIYPVKGLQDLDGDHLPDFVHPAPDLFQTHRLDMYVSRQAPGDDGPRFVDTILTPDDPAPIGADEKAVNRALGNIQVATLAVATWRQVIDWNGDGRPDIVDAQKGRDSAGRPSPRHWHVWLNRPPSPANPPGGPLEWREIDVDVGALRDAVFARHDMSFGGAWNKDKQLPIARSQAQQSTYLPSCHSYVFDAGRKLYVQVDCHDDTGYVNKGSTITEWKLADLNGDGFPDFVFNGSRVAYRFVDGCPASCPATVGDLSQLPFGCNGQCYKVLEVDIPTSNSLLVLYNPGIAAAAGGGTTRPTWTGSPVVLRRDSGCGVERRHYSDYHEHGQNQRTQDLECGFIDADGDGLADYVARETAGERPLALLGNGLPQAQIEASFELGHGLAYPVWEQMRALPLPGPIALVRNGERACSGPQDESEYVIRQYADLVDLTGDGIPDYVFLGLVGPDGQPIVEPPKPGEPIGDRTWWVMVGTGRKFKPARPIVAPDGLPFELQRTIERCNSFRSRVAAGVVDMDGDGHLDMVQASWGGAIMVAPLIGSSGQPGALDAGRIAAVENGNGGVTRLGYGSAKRDAVTAHLLPFPEVVVESVTTTTERAHDVLVPTRYAYGEARRYYHPLLGRWIFPGYGRRVIQRVAEASISGGEVGRWAGAATVEDTVRLDQVYSTFDRMSRVGRSRGGFILAGELDPDPKALLGAPITSDTRTIQSLYVDYTTVPQARSATAVATAEECGDVDPFASGQPASPDLCRTIALVAKSLDLTWEGVGPIGTPRGVTSKQTVESFDSLGRPTLVHHWNDMAREDDDVCHTLAYAAETGRDSTAPLHIGQVSVDRWTDCGGAQPPKVLSGERTLYDGLLEGQVKTGLPTSTIVERYDAGGAKLSETTLEKRTFTWFGGLNDVLRTRSDGKSHLDTLSYEPFGALLRKTARTGQGMTSLEQTFDYDPDLRRYTTVDANLVTQRVYLDRFGRPIKVTRGTSPEQVLSEISYQDQPSQDGSRSVTVTTRQSATDAGVVSRAIAYVDELDRARHTDRLLGADYGDARLVTGYTSFDVFGRVAFIQDDFKAGDVATPPFGTSYAYDAAGRTRCVAQSPGYNPSWTTTNSAFFPTCFTYDYGEKMAVTRRFGPNERDPGGQHAGDFDETRFSAIGRVLSRSRYHAGKRVDRADFEYDRMGGPRAARRFIDPERPEAGVVEWRWAHDSLGQLLRVEQPSVPALENVWNDWGELTQTSWLEPNKDGVNVRHGLRFEWDSYGRGVARDQFRSGAQGDTLVEHTEFHYDSAAPDGRQADATGLRGRLAWAASSGRTTYFGYDDGGRANLVRRVDDDQPQRIFAERATFSPGGLPLALAFDLPDVGVPSETLQYKFDSADRARSVELKDAAGSKTIWSATTTDVLGRYRGVRRGNGITELYDYRSGGRQEPLSYSWSGPSLKRSVAFDGYDGDGRLLGETVTEGGVATRDVFGYDARYRLTSADRTVAGTQAPGENGSFDSLGAPSFWTTRGVTATYAPAPTDPDRAMSGTRAGRPVLMKYDARGNLVWLQTEGEDARRFTFDQHNRLTNVRFGDRVAKVAYDSEGELSKVDVSGTPSEDRVERHYGPFIEERTVKGGTRMLIRRLPGPSGVTAERRSTGGAATTLYYHADRQGLIATTRDDGSTAQRLRFSAFGVPEADTSSPSERVYSQWSGSYALPAFGIAQMGARTYVPEMGRFLQRDPLASFASFGSPHPYAYAAGDPINLWDPTGEQTECFVCPREGEGYLYDYLNFQYQMKWNDDHVGDVVMFAPNLRRPGPTTPLILPGGEAGDFWVYPAHEITRTLQWDMYLRWRLKIESLHQLYSMGPVVGSLLLSIQYYREGDSEKALDHLILFGVDVVSLGVGILEARAAAAAEELAASPLARAGEAALIGRAGPVRSPSLRIVNPHFEHPPPRTLLQNMVKYENGLLASDPSRAAAVLTPTAYAAAQRTAGSARMQYGNALERLVAARAHRDFGNMFLHLGGPNRADFLGLGIAQGLTFDVTTDNARAIAQHLARMNAPGKFYPNLQLALYSRPYAPGFMLFP